MATFDLGLQVNKNGAGAGAAALTTSYTAGSSFSVGGMKDLRLWLEVAGAAGTNMTAAVLKLQTCRTDDADTNHWEDVIMDRVDGTSVSTVEHTRAVTANATRMAGYVTTNHRLMEFCRVLVKATSGGALVAGDTVAVYVRAGS